MIPSEVSPNTVNNSPISKGSPFTRFLTIDTPCKKRAKDRVSVGAEISVNHCDSAESPDTPKDTGDARLERLLTEAAEEASTRLHKSSFIIASKTPLNTASNPKTMGDTGTEVNPSEKTTPDQEDKDCSTSSDSTSKSDLDFSSTGEMDRTAEKPLKRRKKEREQTRPRWKSC